MLSRLALYVLTVANTSSPVEKFPPERADHVMPPSTMTDGTLTSDVTIHGCIAIL